jgi:hypothetical protein
VYNAPLGVDRPAGVFIINPGIKLRLAIFITAITLLLMLIGWKRRRVIRCAES